MVMKSSLAEWLNHPVTEEFMEAVRLNREEIKEAWASGAFTEKTFEGTMQRNAENIGKIQILEDVLDHTIFGVISEEEEEDA